MVFFLISSMKYFRFFVFLRDSRLILLSVDIIIVLGMFLFNLLSLLLVVLELLPFGLLDYLSICHGASVSFGVLVCSVCI